MPTVDLTEELLRLLRHHKAKGRQYVFLSPENLTYLQQSPRPSQTPASSDDTARKQAQTDDQAVQQQASPQQSAASSTPRKKERVSDSRVGQMDWETLISTIQSCTACPLHSVRTQTVPGAGNMNAELMFIGEAPGEEEDRQGLPFVGKAGQQLDKMIKAMQFEREEVFIGNIVKCRPPANRVPQNNETSQCLPYLERQIELIQPRIIVLLGSTPLSQLTGARSINRAHGQWYEVYGIPAVPTFHPSFLLRSPAKKKEAWEDLKQVMRYLGKDPEETMRRRQTSS